MELIVSILAGVIIIEVYAWVPYFSKWLLERTVRRVCVEDQERCREEWYADLDALPNTLVKLWFALSNFSGGAADRINADFFEAKCGEIDDVFKEIVSSYHANVEELREIEIQYSRSQGWIEHVVNDAVKDALSSLEARSGSTIEQFSDPYLRCARSFEKFGQILIRAANRCRDLIDVSVDRARSRLDHIDSVLKTISSKRDQLTELARQQKLSSDVLASLLESITEDLAVLRTLDSNDWDDDSAVKEREKILAAIRNCNLRIRG